MSHSTSNPFVTLKECFNKEVLKKSTAVEIVYLGERSQDDDGACVVINDYHALVSGCTDNHLFLYIYNSDKLEIQSITVDLQQVLEQKIDIHLLQRVPYPKVYQQPTHPERSFEL